MSAGLLHSTINMRMYMCFPARVTMPGPCHCRSGRHIPAVGCFSAVCVSAPSIAMAHASPAALW